MTARLSIVVGFAAVLLGIGFAAYELAAPVASTIDLDARLLAPGSGGLMGTDQLGRDILMRVIAGAPWSLGVALGANMLSMAIGITLGLVAAEFSGFTRQATLQAVNLTQSFPTLVAALAAVAILGQSALGVVLILGLLSWPVFARVVYAEALAAQQRPYVTAARIGGVSRPLILWRHVLPVLTPSLTAMTAFHFADMLVAASALSFLGVGAPLGSPAWGAMLAESRPYLFQAPWMLIVPAAALALTVLVLNLAGDGLARHLGGRSRMRSAK